MGDIELTMTGVVFVIGGGTVTVDMIAEKLATVGHLAIAANAQTIALGMLHHAIGCIDLRQ